jgi:twitching motility protein PilT
MLINTDSVKRMIRENKVDQIYDVIHSGAQAGMVSKDISLVNLVKKNLISREQALPYMRMPQLLTTPGM